MTLLSVQSKKCIVREGGGECGREGEEGEKQNRLVKNKGWKGRGSKCRVHKKGVSYELR